MKIAVAILNWNGLALLEEFLPSVVEFSPNTEIYVIDNASTDNSIDYISRNFPQIRIIENEDNLGYAKGYNEGIKKILKPHPEFRFPDIDAFCLLNSDVKVSKNWLNPIIELFKKNHEIAVIQPKLRDYKNPEKFEYAGAGGGLIDNLGYPYCRGRVFWDVETDTHQYDNTQEVFWASGACFFIRTVDYKNSGGFDENFFAHMEEIDLCWRLKNSGRKIYYCGSSEVYHLGGGTLKSNNPQKTFLNFRNSLWMLVKNLPKHKVFPVVFARLTLDGITALIFLVYEGFPHFWAVMKSHFSFYGKLFLYLKMRNPGIKTYAQKNWLPFQYFLKKRKKFSDLK